LSESERLLLGSPTGIPIAEAIQESLFQVDEIRRACSLVDALVDDVTEPMRRWLQETVQRDGVGEELVDTLWSAEVTNAITLANEWAKVESGLSESGREDDVTRAFRHNQ